MPGGTDPAWGAPMHLCKSLGALVLTSLFALACGGNKATTTGSGGQGTGGGSGGGGGSGACAADEHTTPDAGCDTEITWSAAPPIAAARDHHFTVAVDLGAASARFVYAGGGFSQASSMLLGDVTRAPIASDGTLGAWTAAAPLPVPIAGMGVVVTHGEAILAGGFFSAKTWTAAIQPDGSLGTWTAGPALSQQLFHTAAVVHGDFLYVVGGLGGTNLDTTSDEVRRAPIAADGTLGAFTIVAHLPYTLSHHVLLIDGATMYVIGGQTGNPNDNSGTPHKEVQIAALAADGSLGAWTQGPETPDAYSAAGGVVHDGFLYVAGGILDATSNEAGGVPTANVIRAAVLAPGMLGAWTVDAPSKLPVARSHVHQLPVVGSHLYSVSGMTDTTDTTAVYVGVFQ